MKGKDKKKEVKKVSVSDLDAEASKLRERLQEIKEERLYLINKKKNN